MIWTTFNLKKWKHAETKAKIISWDVTSYYGYLPAAFIHKDLSLDFIDIDEVFSEQGFVKCFAHVYKTGIENQNTPAQKPAE